MTPQRVRASLGIAGAIILGIAMVGFMRATSQDHYDFVVPLRHLSEDVHDDIPQARTYLQMRQAPRGEAVLPEALAGLASNIPGRMDPVQMDGTSKSAALADRSERRAYHGAPPTIPHPVGQGTASECMACHDTGIRFGTLRATPIPHEAFTSCTQCHAMQEPNMPWTNPSEGVALDPRDVPNSFVGTEPPLAGPRWTGIAPPAIAHPTFMHERCMSCHGPNGPDALRSTHPNRQSCEQCHVPQAPLEQRPGGR